MYFSEKPVVSSEKPKASSLIKGTNTKCAFVSTNSITQGEQVAAVWKPLIDLFSIQIDFAYRTFRWDSESSEKAHVHCVIVGFSYKKKNCHTDSILLTQNQDKSTNGKSLDFPNPCGNKKRIFSADGTIEEDELLTKSPQMEKYIRPFTSGDDFINNKKK